MKAMLFASAGMCTEIRDAIIRSGKKYGIEVALGIYAAGTAYLWEKYSNMALEASYDLCFVEHAIQTGPRADEAMKRSGMPANMTATQKMKAARSLYGNARIVIIGEGEDEMLDAFYWNPMAFIRKSHLLEDMDRLFSFLKETECDDMGERLASIPYGKRKNYIVNPDQIMYCMSKEHYVCFAFRDGSMPLHRMKLTDAYNVLQYYGFERIHNRYIVNTQYVVGEKKNSVMVAANQDAEVIDLPMSRRWKLEMGEENRTEI